MKEDLVDIFARPFIRESTVEQPHLYDLSCSSRFITETLWLETLMNTSTSKNNDM